MICPRCQSPLPQNATSCPRCGLLFYPQQGPGAQQQSDKSNTGWIIAAVLTVLIIGALVAGIIWWSQSKSSSSSGATVTATTTETTSQAPTDAQPATVTTPTTTATTTAAPGWPTGVTQVCSDDLATGPNTSCPFAQNVAEKLLGIYSDGNLPDGQTFQVQAYSPVTGDMYSMSCVAGPIVKCTGGNNASVYWK